MRIAINGFGRIGRTFLRTVLTDAVAGKQIEIVAINVGPSDLAQAAYVFKYDSVMGTFPGQVEVLEGCLHVHGLRIQLFAEKDAAQLPWRTLGVEWVVDCSGKYTHGNDARKHIDAGAKKVLISAPAHDVDCTIVPGVNNQAYKKSEHTIVSLGSCTTNALIPLIDVIEATWGIESAMVVTTHAYTPSQLLLDNFTASSDARRGRSGSLNMIPTSTGADRMVSEIFPHLKGKVAASALRVPVPKVSLIDVTWVGKKHSTVTEINAAFKRAAETKLKGILETVEVPLVSSDFAGNSHSVVFDSNLTAAVATMGKVSGWYDNEWGYSSRLKDFFLTIN